MKHLLCMDFESWILSRELLPAKLSDKELIRLDDGYTWRSLDFTLKLLKKYRTKITFFVVFKLEDLFPGIIDRILRDGHEVGWHSYSHALLVDDAVLKKELQKSRRLLKKYSIKGFQAPDLFFFKKGYRFLFDAGIRYSSSMYGNSNMVYTFSGIKEIPISTSRSTYAPTSSQVSFPANMSLRNLLTFGIPYGSSYFWSVLGFPYYAHKLEEANRKKKTVNLFIHNWQLMLPHSNSKRFIPNEQAPFFRNPLYTPYKINVVPCMESLLSQFKFQKCDDYVRGL